MSGEAGKEKGDGFQNEIHDHVKREQPQASATASDTTVDTDDITERNKRMDASRDEFHLGVRIQVRPGPSRSLLLTYFLQAVPSRFYALSPTVSIDSILCSAMYPANRPHLLFLAWLHVHSSVT